MSDLVQTIQTVMPGLADQVKAQQASLPLGDELVADAVKDALDDHRWGLGDWLDEELALPCLVIAVHEPEASVYDVFVKLFGPHGRQQVHNKMIRAALLGERVSLADLSKQPYREHLSALSGLLWAHGLVRMAHLASSIEHGCPPSDPFNQAERSLYLRLVPEKVRRTKRSFFRFSYLADSVKHWNDRAERLMGLWLLHPVTPRLEQYMGMLHAAYVDGRDPEAVVLSRAILERAIADACHSLRVTGEDRMLERIKALETRKKVLSHAAAGGARAVWSRGNKVIHDDPDFVQDSFNTVECLLAVLDQLHDYIGPPDDAGPPDQPF